VSLSGSFGDGPPKRQALPSVYDNRRIFGAPDNPIPGRSEGLMVGVAIAAFVALFGWGATYFGWTDPDGKVQLALAASFILGVFAGYKGRG
jgi:hypothetical protein